MDTEKEATILGLTKRISDQLLIMENDLGNVLKRDEAKSNKEPAANEGMVVSNVVDAIITNLERNINKFDELLMALRSQILNKLS